MSKIAKLLVEKSLELYGCSSIPLHRPVFIGNEKQYLVDCIDSNFVSSVGQRVIDFETQISTVVGTRRAIATVNGTASLHVAMQLVGVEQNNEVITQALTFVATCNAIHYLNASPVFVDVDRDTLGMSPTALLCFLESNAELREDGSWNTKTDRRISACVPMHTFGIPCRIHEIQQICQDWKIPLVEDAAESLGSYSRGRHTGSFGTLGTFSFNGNKIITTGGGGMIVTNDESIAHRAKHLTTTAKIPHAYEYVHDDIGYNYRLPNLNAALGCAQMERLDWMLEKKREVSRIYLDFFEEHGIKMVTPLAGDVANNWLNAIVLSNRAERDEFLEYTNGQGVMTRPIWRLMSELPKFHECQHDGLEQSRWLEDRVVNVPSSVPLLGEQ
ncbi:LegC family aminotransferase [Litorivicinus sp.]|nr:LegC family aminotransferase [Litorivicinus sp.]